MKNCSGRTQEEFKIAKKIKKIEIIKRAYTKNDLAFLLRDEDLVSVFIFSIIFCNYSGRRELASAVF
jgi:hypothetical protein